MVSRLTRQLLQKTCHLHSPQSFSHRVHPSQTVHSLSILCFLENKLCDFSGLGKIMSKRSALETLCISPISKKQHLLAADDLVIEKRLKPDNMSAEQNVLEHVGCRQADCVSNLEQSSVSPSGKDDSSATETLDDSGIEITPAADGVLTTTPNVPGFLLVERKSFPAPNFDFVSSPSDSPPSVEVMGCKTVDQNPLTVLNKKEPKGKTAAGLERGSPAKPRSRRGTADIKPNAQSSTKKRQTVGTEPDAGNTALGTNKRCAAPSDDCRPKRVSKKQAAGRVLTSCPPKLAGSPAVKKGKGTVLPATLLDQVVKTVQGNVRTISTQIVAASATKQTLPSETVHMKPAHSIDKCDKTDKSTLADPLLIVGTENVICHSVTSECDAEGSGDGKRDLEKLEDVIQRSAGEGNTAKEQTRTAEGFKPSTPETSRQKSFVSSHTQACGEQPCLSDMRKKSMQIIGEDRNQDAELEVDLSAVFPVECVETAAATNSGMNKKKKKATEKKKKGRGQRQLDGGDGESLLGVLSECIPDKGRQVKKRTKDQVYNLSALFSGSLGDGPTPPQRVRPNYFLAIQITSPDIKAGLSDVQKAVEDEKAGLKPAFVSVDKAHLTLGVMHLPDQEAINRAKAALDEFKALQEQERQKHQQQPKQQQPDQQQLQQQRPEEQQLEQHQHLEQQRHEQQQPEQQQSEQQQSEQQQPEQQQSELQQPEQQQSEQQQPEQQLPEQQQPEQQQSEQQQPEQQLPEQQQPEQQLPEQQQSEQPQPEQQQLEQQQPEQQLPEQQQSEQPQPEQQQSKQQQAEKEGTDCGNPLTLEVKGLDHFRHTVVFAKVTEGDALERLNTIAASVRASVEKQNISLDGSAFVPHITIMKMSKDRAKLQRAGIKKIDPQLYEASRSRYFGRETVATIQLCSMTKPKQNEYYYIEHEVPF